MHTFLSTEKYLNGEPQSSLRFFANKSLRWVYNALFIRLVYHSYISIVVYHFPYSSFHYFLQQSLVPHRIRYSRTIFILVLFLFLQFYCFRLHVPNEMNVRRKKLVITRITLPSWW